MKQGAGLVTKNIFRVAKNRLFLLAFSGFSTIFLFLLITFSNSIYSDKKGNDYPLKFLLFAAGISSVITFELAGQYMSRVGTLQSRKEHSKRKVLEFATSAGNSFTRKQAFLTGLTLGSVLGASSIILSCYGFLTLNKSSVAMVNGKILVNELDYNKQSNSKTASTNSGNSNGEISLNVIDKPTSIHSSLININNSLANNNVTQLNAGINTTSTAIDTNSDSGNVTLISTQELPGFDPKGYLVPPPKVAMYEKALNLQADNIAYLNSVKEASLEFKEVVIRGIRYFSTLSINPSANKSTLAFRLSGTQQAILLQFGLSDVNAGSNTSDAYTVKIYVDGKVFWTGVCSRSQNRQILSVPLNVSDANALAIEVTSHPGTTSSLYFTETRLLEK